MIAEPVMESPEEKIIIPCPVKMTKDRQILKDNYKNAAEKIIQRLEKGENVVYLTLGDPTIYSTYMYLHKLVEKAGFAEEIINGVPSFCAAAARTDLSLCEHSEQLHIIPSTDSMNTEFNLPGTKVLMKVGGRLPEIKQLLKERRSNAYMVENCCMENERIYRDVDEMCEHAGYLSLIIVKDREKKDV